MERTTSCREGALHRRGRRAASGEGVQPSGAGRVAEFDVGGAREDEATGEAQDQAQDETAGNGVMRMGDVCKASTIYTYL